MKTIHELKQDELEELRKYKEMLEDVLNHIESGLIDLESSGYLLDNIKRVLNKE